MLQNQTFLIFGHVMKQLVQLPNMKNKNAWKKMMHMIMNSKTLHGLTKETTVMKDW